MPTLKFGQCEINCVIDEDMPPNEVKFVNPDGTTTIITNLAHYHTYEEQEPLTFNEMNKERRESLNRIKRIRRQIINEKKISIHRIR